MNDLEPRPRGSAGDEFGAGNPRDCSNKPVFLTAVEASVEALEPDGISMLTPEIDGGSWSGIPTLKALRATAKLAK